jgi:hypothetical protein
MALRKSLDHPDDANYIRDVWIITVPIKDQTPLQRNVMSWMTRKATSELDWSMHWALLVGGTYLELRRTSHSPIPVLKVSVWSAERVASIKRSRRIGVIQLQDEQISEAGRDFFIYIIPPSQ